MVPGRVAEGPADERGEVEAPVLVQEVQRAGACVGVVDVGVGGRRGEGGGAGGAGGRDEGEAEQVRGVPDGLGGGRGRQPGPEAAFGVGPDVWVGGFGAEEPGFARDEEELEDRGAGGEVEGVVCEEGCSGGGEGVGDDGGSGRGGGCGRAAQ